MHNAIDLSDMSEDFICHNLQDKKTITLGVIGRMDASKGFDYAIKTIKNLEQISRGSDKRFILKIAGDGKNIGSLKNLVKKLNLESKVEFFGWIENKKEFFDAIDIFLLPSISETFGLVLLEAMKYHKPIIATNADGPKEILRDKIDALLIDLKPLATLSERIAKAVLIIVEDRNLADLLIKNSANRLKENFSNQSLMLRMEEIVGKI
jgi:glycosyltransferase involved in cell wall biosynthesis